MADPVAEIESQLKRPSTLANSNEQRKSLNQNFMLLSPQQAEQLLVRILSFDQKDSLPWHFRRLDRHVRLELLLKLAGRLGHLGAEEFHELLTGNGAASPTAQRLQLGLRVVFPAEMKEMRERFLQALRNQFSAFHPQGSGPSDGKIPRLLLEFRNSGHLSWDNKCPSRILVPSTGLGLDHRNGLNYMEIRGNVIGHRSDATYQFRRTRETGKWYHLGNDTWKQWDYDPPGTDDDGNDSDEFLFPEHHHIYVIDTPGFVAIPPGGPSPTEPGYIDVQTYGVTEYVYIMNAVETVEVKVGTGTWRQIGQLEWYTVTWLEKADGLWRRKPNLNYIRTGSASPLTMDEPPANP
jgi:hypothetical protein